MIKITKISSIQFLILINLLTMRVSRVVKIVRYKENILMKGKNLWINQDFVKVFEMIKSKKK